MLFGNHRGFALPGPNPTPPGIIGLGGVVRLLFKSEQNGTAPRWAVVQGNFVTAPSRHPLTRTGIVKDVDFIFDPGPGFATARYGR